MSAVEVLLIIISLTQTLTVVMLVVAFNRLDRLKDTVRSIIDLMEFRKPYAKT